MMTAENLLPDFNQGVERGNGEPNSAKLSRGRATPKPSGSFYQRLLTSQPKRALTQAELSLETVRVVRNNLAEADFELVSPESKGANEPSKTTLIKQAWSELTGKALKLSL
jgi:hypothetical protein